jgi:hypothetical protein
MALPLILIPLIMTLISRLGGWAALAERYPMTGEPPAALCRFGYGLLGRWCGYKGCLIVSADQRGLYLRLWPVFSFGHAPIFIPWAEIQEIRRKSLWLLPMYRIVARGMPEAELSLYGRSWTVVRPHAEAARVAIFDT